MLLSVKRMSSLLPEAKRTISEEGSGCHCTTGDIRTSYRFLCRPNRAMNGEAEGSEPFVKSQQRRFTRHHLVVHPPSSRDCRHQGNARLFAGTVTTPAAPLEGMTMGSPVAGCLVHAGAE